MKVPDTWNVIVTCTHEVPEELLRTQVPGMSQYFVLPKYLKYFFTGKYLATPGWSRLCLLLDYDGTLAPHGAHPDLTVLPPATKEVSIALQEVKKELKAGLLRCCKDLRTCLRFLSLSSLGAVSLTSRPRSDSFSKHAHFEMLLRRLISRTSPMLATMGWTSSTLTAQSLSHPCQKR